METAPTSIEVLLRPNQSQSGGPSDLRGSEPHECIQHLAVPGGHPSIYEPGATLLNFRQVDMTTITLTSLKTAMSISTIFMKFYTLLSSFSMYSKS